MIQIKMLLKSVRSFWIIITFSLAISLTFQSECPVDSVSKDGKCLPCNLIFNTVSTPIMASNKLNICTCKDGYSWSLIDLECFSVSENNVEGQTSHAMNQVLQTKRVLTTQCDISKGFININGQCINCRNIPKSIGFARDSTSCYCQSSYSWTSTSNNCACFNYNVGLYTNGDMCTLCDYIANNETITACYNCYGNPFAYSDLGCINCTAIPHGLYAQVDLNVGYCVCENGYTYNRLLGACFCDQYYFSTGSGCQSCSSLVDSKEVNDCNECQNSFFHNGYYCQQSSNIQYFNSSTNACQTGYDIKVNPIIGQTIGCACSASAGYYLTGSSCQSCLNFKDVSQSYQNCMTCSQTGGYFKGTVECIHCQAVQFATGTATVDGCECTKAYSWNTLTTLCECDWAEGFFTKGMTCLNCLDIAHTGETTNNAGCNCIKGFSWNSNTFTCECDLNAGNFYLPTVQGCIDCNTINWSTGKPINGSSCQCYQGTIWSSEQVSCICDINQNFVMVDSYCLDCGSWQFTNGFATSQGCGCLPGYIWIQSEGACDCPPGYVNMGNQCVSCSIAINNLTGATVDGCKSCSVKQGFASYESICYACSKQILTSGTASNASGCNCIDIQQTWYPIFGGCICTSSYAHASLSCVKCSNNCSCTDFYDINGNLSQACVTCQVGNYSNGTLLVNGSCACFPGYAWSIDIQLTLYPFECVCSILAGGYLNGSTCYNCSQLPVNGTVTAAGCNKCDPSQGFLYLSANYSCIVCSMQPGSNGKATIAGCGCLQGVWNINTLACESFNCSIANCQICSSNASCYSCAEGYLLTVDQSKCSLNCLIAYCDYCSSSSTCQTCITGYQLNSNSSRCLAIQCIENCGLCLTNTTCFYCVDAYILSNDTTQCVFSCSITGCDVCSSFASCSKCSVGYYLTSMDTLCLISCTIQNCGYCFQNSTYCDSCKTGFIAYEGLCYNKNCTDNCNLCSSTTICHACNAGYTLANNGSSCHPTCVIANCEQCPSDSNCSSCLAGYYLSNSNNSTQCRLTCSSPNCESCQGNSNDCTQCKSDFKLFDWQCYPSNCVANCDLCLSNSTCRSCLKGYSPSYDRDECFLVCNNPNCQICSEVDTNCTQCTYGYTLQAGQCYLDFCDIPNCVQCSSPSSCEQCDTTYAYNLVANQCKPACLSAFPNCLLCSSASNCSACQTGYSLGQTSANVSDCLPLCTITNCWICSSNQTCLSCNANYSLSSDQRKCSLSCSVANCDVCQNTTTCSQCLSGYTLKSNGCLLKCEQGYYNSGNSSVIVCESCSIFSYLCQSCDYVNNSLVCLSCPGDFYLNTLANQCFGCYSYDINCYTCTQLECTSCLPPGALASDGSCQIISCQVPNCLFCSTSSNLTCLTCNSGFSYNVETGACQNLACPPHFIFQGESCACPTATMLINQQCLLCSDSHCMSCNSFGCSVCFTGYYLSFNLLCLPCAVNCDICTSQYCSQCSSGFSLLPDGVCSSIAQGISALKIQNNFISCSPGCSVCVATSINEMSCTKMQNGYAFFEGIIMQCVNPICQTCTGGIYLCTSCVNGYSLQNGNCLACLDLNALTCLPTNLNYSITCSPGYTTASSASAVSTGGFCLPCSANCLKCDFNGPYNCDAFQCTLGFVQLLGTTNCTACLNSCPVCDNNNLNLCIDCGPRRYKDNTSQCSACPATCATCTSETICTACLVGYSLANGICTSNLGYPCAVTGVNAECTQCFEGYRLNGTVCAIDLSCNNISACITCPYEYYLFNSTCLICPELTRHCLTCDSYEGNCVLCKKGYYFIQYGCSPCPSHCNACSSPSFCIQAANAYYLEVFSDGSNSGMVKACASPCLTCAYSSNYCLSCVGGYNISGSTCFSTSPISIQLVLGPSTTDSTIFNASDTDQIKLANIMKNINWLTDSFCSILPSSLKINGSCVGVFRFTALSVGSIIVNAQINANGVQDISQTQNTIIQNLNSNGIPGVSIVSISMASSPSSQYPPLQSNSSSSSKLPIIIGICVGGALIIVIVVIIIVLKRRRVESSTQQRALQSDVAMSVFSYKEEQSNPKSTSQKLQVLGSASSQSINRDSKFESKSIEFESEKN